VPFTHLISWIGNAMVSLLFSTPFVINDICSSWLAHNVQSSPRLLVDVNQIVRLIHTLFVFVASTFVWHSDQDSSFTELL
jgi:hypothetical protein